MDIYINPPKRVYTTVKEFYKFTCWELASFFCNWEMCVEEVEGGDLKILTTRENLVYLCENNNRFSDVEWRVYSSVGLYYCIITKEHSLNSIILKYFSRYLLK